MRASNIFRQADRLLIFLAFFFLSAPIVAQSNLDTPEPLINNTESRISQSLNGEWQYIVDPYETGFYDYRYKERAQKDPDAYWSSDKPRDKTDRKEHGYSDKYSIQVPGDWNSQDPKFLYYEGTVWYRKVFDYRKLNPAGAVFVYFGGVNYRADVYLNGKKLGRHSGGFTPFNFSIPDSILKTTGNYLVVKVDNKRYADEIPTLNTDWWNYGGITRDVKLIELPAGSAIVDYTIQLRPPHASPEPSSGHGYEAAGWVRLRNAQDGEEVSVEIPELKLRQTFAVKAGKAIVQFRLPGVQLWSPENPKWKCKEKNCC